MGFKIYTVEPKPDETFALDGGRILRFSSPDGLVAIWTKSHRDRADKPWQVTPAEWLEVTGLGLDAGKHWIVFEQRDDEGRLKLARLLSVSGLCARGKTDMLFAMEPLGVVSELSPVIVRREERQRIWSEELVLEGVPEEKSALWCWGSPHLAIGSATVGGKVSH